MPLVKSNVPVIYLTFCVTENSGTLYVCSKNVCKPDVQLENLIVNNSLLFS